MKPNTKNTGGQIIKTKKRGDTIVLPGCTEIFQSNRITNGKFEKFGLLHAKIFVCLIKKLQEAVKFDMSGGDWRQLDLFTGIKSFDKDNSSIYVPIPLSEITTPNRYAEFFEAAKELRFITVKLKSALGAGYASYTGLISSVEEAVQAKGKSKLYLQINKEAARLLIEIDKNKNNQPVHYTKYLYEVAMNGTNKYTWKLYEIISSWKSKGGFRCTLTELKALLGIKDKDYASFSDFKRRVLIPIQKDLQCKSDCWFNCRDARFEIREGKAVVALNFKIITPQLEDELKDKAEHIRYLLRTYYRFKESHLSQIQPLFSTTFSSGIFESILHKLIALKQHFEAVRNTDEAVFDIAAYTLKSLQEEFIH